MDAGIRPSCFARIALPDTFQSFARIALPDTFQSFARIARLDAFQKKVGTHDYLRRLSGLAPEPVAETIEKKVKKGEN